MMHIRQAECSADGKPLPDIRARHPERGADRQGGRSAPGVLLAIAFFLLGVASRDLSASIFPRPAAHPEQTRCGTLRVPAVDGVSAELTLRTGGGVIRRRSSHPDSP